VTKLAQPLGHCDALEQRIGESRQLAGQLLQTVLREALAVPGGAGVAVEAALERKVEKRAAEVGDLFANVG
jgi:hypothetical protein